MYHHISNSRYVHNRIEIMLQHRYQSKQKMVLLQTSAMIPR